MSFVYENFISGVLQAGVGDTDTSFTLIDASDWPSWGGGVVSRLTLSDGKQPEEIVEVTDRVANTLYVSRGKEGTLPRVWAAGSQIYLALTKESFPEMASGVISVHGRVGTVVGVTGDYNAAQITNNSSVSGATIKDALNTLLASISSSVISVFGRTGAVVAAASDYDASQVDNDSAVVGSKVSDALNTLNTALAAKLNSSAVSAYGLTLIDDVDAAAARTTLGLGALATLSTVDLTSQVTGDLPFSNLAQIATSSFLGRVTASTGDVEVLTVAQAKTLLNLTGTNSGDQTITLTSDVTGSGTGSFATTIANNAVSLAKMADIATASFLGRNTAGTGDPEVLSVATAKTMLNLTGTNSGDQTITLTGDVTGSGTASFAATIGNNVVTYAKMQNVSATNRFLGRITAGAGDPEELTGAQATSLLNVFTTSLQGVVPASGGGTTNFLRADGTWAAPPGGGGGSVLNLPGQDSAPTAPSAGSVNVYGRRLAAGYGPEYPPPSVQGSGGHIVDLASLNTPSTYVGVWGPLAYNLTSVGTIGMPTPVSMGTPTAIGYSNTNKGGRSRTVRYVSSASAGSSAGIRTTYNSFYPVSQARLRFIGAFSIPTNTTGYQLFYGLCNSSAALVGDASTLTNMIGVGFDAADASTGNYYLMYNDGSGTATKVDLGSSFARSGSMLRLELEFDGTGWIYSVTNLNTSAVTSGRLTTDIPTGATAALLLKGEVRNGAIASVCNINLSTLSISYTTE